MDIQVHNPGKKQRKRWRNWRVKGKKSSTSMDEDWRLKTIVLFHVPSHPLLPQNSETLARPCSDLRSRWPWTEWIAQRSRIPCRHWSQQNSHAFHAHRTPDSNSPKPPKIPAPAASWSNPDRSDGTHFQTPLAGWASDSSCFGLPFGFPETTTF